MADPLHFCGGSFGAYSAIGPFALIRSGLDAVMRIVDADTGYQTETARQDEREESLRREKKTAATYKAAAEAAAKRNAANAEVMAKTIFALAAELERLRKAAAK